MKYGRIITLCFALLALGSAFCSAAQQPAELSQVVRTLEQGYASLNDLQADFSQRSTILAMKREEKGGGELFIKKGAGKEAMFRFDYTKPKQQIVCNGKKVWYYLPDQKQVMVMNLSQMFEGGNGIALNYLTGLGHVSKDFSISFAKEPRDKKGNYLLVLVPKQKNPAMARLELTIQGEAVERFVSQGHPSTPFPIVGSAVVDQTGNTTRIEYTNVKTNRGVSSSRFSFKIPAGVETIKR